MFFGGIIVCLCLPFFMQSFLDYFNYQGNLAVAFDFIFLSSGLCSLYILWQLKTMFKTLLGGNPFVFDNVKCLRKCSVASFLIALIYLFKTVFWFSVSALLISTVFALLGLFSLTLKDVFKQAVFYKEETDWTV